MTEHERLSGDYFLQGYTCAQAILLAFRDVTGLDDETALKVSASFGGGMGRLRSVCGAVSGIFMVLGMRCGFTEPNPGPAKTEHYAKVQRLAAAFREEFGTINCGELLAAANVKTDSSPVPDERTEKYYKIRPCTRQIMAAARILDEFLAKEAGAEA